MALKAFSLGGMLQLPSMEEITQQAARVGEHMQSVESKLDAIAAQNREILGMLQALQEGMKNGG